MTKFNELKTIYHSSESFEPILNTSSHQQLGILLSIIGSLSLIFLITYSAKTSTKFESLLNLITYLIVSIIASLSISFAVLFVSSAVGVYA